MPLTLIVGDRDLTDEAGASLTWSTVDPGGCETLSFTATNAESLPTVGDRARLYEGLECIWDGRVEEPGQHYRGKLVSGRVSCVGAGARLKDDPFVEVYVHSRFDGWGDMPLNQKIRLSTLGFDYGSFSYARDSDGLVCALPNRSVGGASTTQAWFIAPDGVTIAKLQYKGTTTTYPGGWAAPQLLFSTIDDDSGAASVALTLDGTLRTAVAAAARRFVALNFPYSAGVTATPAAGSAVTYSKLALFGNHGLTLRAVTGEADGLYCIDIALDALSRGSGIDRGPVSTDTTIAVHVTYTEPTTRHDVIDEMIRMTGLHWGVWPVPDGQANPQLWLTEPPETATAIVARSDCAGFDPAQRLSDLYDTLEVSYQTPAGVTERVTVTRTNPFLPSSLAGRTKAVSMGPGTESNAQDYGTTLLALYEQQARAAGPIDLPGAIQLPGGGTKPAHMLLAGRDRLQVTDLPNAGPWTETDTRRFDTFRIRRTESRAGRGGQVTTTCELDAGADLTEVLLARYQDALEGAGV